MESSFFEYRNDTEVYSGSEEEVIDNSLIDDSFAQKKKNRTVFVAESEESTTDDDTENEETIPKNTTKSVVKHSQVAKGHNIMSSSDDDSNPRGSIRRQSDSSNKVVLSSSEDDQASPEMVPKRRPPLRKSSEDSNNSFIGRKTKKRIMQLDSDTENSIIIEHDKHKKLLCMKNTPLKITNGKNIVNDSIVYSNDNSMIENDNETKTSDEDDDMTRCDETNETHTISNLNTNEHNTKDIGERLGRDTSNDHVNSQINVTKNKKDCLTDSKKLSKGKTNEDHSYGKTKVNQNKTKEVSKSDGESDTDEEVESGDEVESDDDGPDEDQMVMSRATRMSIMGVIPNGSDSDESDFIQSDDSNQNSGASTPGLSEFPEGLPSKTPEKPPQESEENLDTTKLTCSPFSSPLQDITNKSINIIKSSHSDDECTILSDTEENKPSGLKNKVQSFTKRENFIKYDDDVTIIDTKLEVIALSSDEEDEVSFCFKLN